MRKDEFIEKRGRTVAEWDALEARIADLENVLRDLSSYVGTGGVNADKVDADDFYKRIMYGIDALVKVGK